MLSFRCFAKNSLLVGALVFSAGSAHANLINNGSFENPDVDSGSWEYFTSSQVPGWDGDNIEIWDSFNGVNAVDGDQFAELNAHPDQTDPFGIYQDITTVANQWYNVAFAYRARANDSEVFEFAAADESWTLNDHTTGEWSLFSGMFKAESNLSRIQFKSVSPDGTIGNFVDDVRVTAKVPEPGTLALLGLGLAGLGLSRRRR
ncbi:PEP-CTERM sorting domain-containing protein [Tamilnaduibacter salinus]|uniref:PEP-CTERM sorting domain-containing protein n=1 Tax=Tamilnaduibacter salinus TaxID=1484056 RepID=A0A2A2I6T2_9GAMM|nr:PEP-CTERM sorting domain-containing protein [Tamilnaduibacter salinus]PAV27088.1 PEP-CTERM sorting domain-containing protein [Tamilnaduibacter salinus]